MLLMKKKKKKHLADVPHLFHGEQIISTDKKKKKKTPNKQNLEKL